MSGYEVVQAGRVIIAYPTGTDASFVVRLAFRLTQGDETPGESEHLGDALDDGRADAVAVNTLEVKKARVFRV